MHQERACLRVFAPGRGGFGPVCRFRWGYSVGLVTGLAMVGAGFSIVQAMGMSLIVFGATAQLGHPAADRGGGPCG